MISVIVIGVLAIALFIFLQQPQFGRMPSGKRLERIQQSPNYREGKFQNLSPTPDLAEGATYYSVLKEFLFQRSKRIQPVDSLPSVKINLHDLDRNEDLIVWFGHSSYFLQADGKRFLVDPVFSGSVSPLGFTNRSYKGSDVYSVADFPDIDYLLISHDHWDHLDYETVIALKSKVGKVVTGLGTGEHFEYWGYSPDTIIEMDWNEGVTLEPGFVIHATPGRHFSGRSFTRNKAIWVSFVLKTPNLNLFIGGDSGYDHHFKTIGDTYGPFDLAILECGQYDKNWKYIHMMPEEVVQAAIDLRATKFMPVHWAKFSLGTHDWDDSILRVTKTAAAAQLPILTPMIGEKVPYTKVRSYTEWWKGLE